MTDLYEVYWANAVNIANALILVEAVMAAALAESWGLSCDDRCGPTAMAGLPSRILPSIVWPGTLTGANCCEGGDLQPCANGECPNS